MTDLMKEARDRIQELEDALDVALKDLEASQDEAAGAHSQLARMQRDAASSAAQNPQPAADIGPAMGPQFDSLQEWVDGWFCAVIEKAPSSTVRWCTRWHEHPEAALRLGQMFADYSRCMAGDPQLGWTNFIRNSLDYYVPTIIGAGGPFAQCTERQHEEPAFLAKTVKS